MAALLLLYQLPVQINDKQIPLWIVSVPSYISCRNLVEFASIWVLEVKPLFILHSWLFVIASTYYLIFFMMRQWYYDILWEGASDPLNALWICNLLTKVWFKVVKAVVKVDCQSWCQQRTTKIWRILISQWYVSIHQ